MHGRLLLTPLAVAAAAGALAAPAAARTVTVTDADAGERVTVAAGDRIRIELDANQTTGYRWTTPRKPKAKVARIVSSRYVAPKQDGDEPLVGAGGTQVTVLRAVAPGATRLRMVYRQVGSGDRGAVFRLRVRVRQGACAAALSSCAGGGLERSRGR